MDEQKRKKIIYGVIAFIVLVALGILFSLLANKEPKSMGNIVLSGIVQQKTNSSLVVDVLTLRNAENQEKILRTITVDEKTVVKKQEKTPIHIFEQEQERFLEAQKRGDLGVKPPLPISEVTFSFNTVAVGDYVTIRVDRDIQKNEQANATSILVNFKEAAPKIVDPTELNSREIGVIGWKSPTEINRLALDKSDGRRIQVYGDGATEYIQQYKKDQKVFLDEMEVFKKAGGTVVPSPVIEQQISFDRVIVGSQIEVQGVLRGDEIIAKKVTVLIVPEQIEE